jgi:phenylpropionate dioxygenase-like ring-hydroxylating dioxygenase large terminal subunit
MYVYNALDEGQKPKLPKEITVDPENDFRLEFIFPNTWQNVISPKMRIVVAFVPIDNGNTLMYLRSYQ